MTTPIDRESVEQMTAEKDIAKAYSDEKQALAYLKYRANGGSGTWIGMARAKKQLANARTALAAYRATKGQSHE